MRTVLVLLALLCGCNDKDCCKIGVVDAAGDTGDAPIIDAPPCSGDCFAWVRIARFDIESGDFDVCFALAGTNTWTPPFVGRTLAYKEVTAYMQLPYGRYDMRIQPPGGSNCDGATIVAHDLVFDAFSFDTVVAYGADLPSQPPNFAVRYVDDRLIPVIHLPEGATNRVRLVHASHLSPAIDLGYGDTGTFVPLFANLDYLQLPTGNGISPLGYIDQGFGPTSLHFRYHGQATDMVTIPNFTSYGSRTYYAVRASTSSTDFVLVDCDDLNETCAPAP